MTTDVKIHARHPTKVTVVDPLNNDKIVQQQSLAPDEELVVYAHSNAKVIVEEVHNNG